MFLPAGTRICVVTAPRSEIRPFLPRTVRLSQVLAFRPQPTRLARLRSKALALAQDANPAGLVEAFRSCLPVDGAAQRSSAGVRHFLDMRDTISARTGATASLNALATSRNLSRRTIENAFRAGAGVGPREYADLIRLNSIRRELIVSDESIGDVVARYGIWHLSRFAQNYRRAFGELPSQTRKR